MSPIYNGVNLVVTIKIITTRAKRAKIAGGPIIATAKLNGSSPALTKAGIEAVKM